MENVFLQSMNGDIGRGSENGRGEVALEGGLQESALTSDEIHIRGSKGAEDPSTQRGIRIDNLE